MDLTKRPEENEEEYLWRIGQLVDSKQISNWRSVIDIINDQLGLTGSKRRDESSFRKRYQASKRFYLNVFSKMINNEYAEQLREMSRKLDKLRVQYRDERNEYNRIIRTEARKESYLDLIKRTIQESVPDRLDYKKTSVPKIKSDNDLIIHLTDLHNGIKIESYFNQYNTDILRNRLEKYLDNIIEIQRRHQSENAYVIIGEVVSGLIHENLRCENNQNLIEQFVSVSTLIADFLSVLSEHFSCVKVYVTPGNHSRVSPKKEQSLKGENFDHLLIPMLSAKLQNFDSIEFYPNSKDESIALFTVRGKIVMSAHGDKDSPSNVVQKFTLLFGQIPDLVYLGHRHKNGMTTVNNTKIIESGCVSGSDNYAIDLRLNTAPEQTVSVVDKDGLVCLYDIQLN